MYAVVGCTDCGGYWLVRDPETQESAKCQTCGTSHRMDRLKRFHTADSRDAAAAARARLLAEKQDGVDPATAAETAFSEGTETTAVADEEYLSAHGIDPESVAEAGDVSSGGSRSREEIVRDAVRETDGREAIIQRAVADGVAAGAAADLLDRLVRRGEATEAGGDYRLL